MSTVTILYEIHIKTCNLIKKVLLIIGERRNLGTIAWVGKYQSCMNNSVDYKTNGETLKIRTIPKYV